jgi:hypothetical protein
MLQTQSILRRATASLLSYALAATFLAGPAQAQANVSAQINNLPLGANVQVLLKNKQKLRGTRGAVTDAGFTLLDSQAGARQLSFDEVTSVKAFNKSHVGRNVVLGVTVGLAAIGIFFVVLAAKFGP